MKQKFCRNCGVKLSSVRGNHRCQPFETTKLSELPTQELKIEKPVETDESAKTIKVRLREIARKFGILTAYQLGKITGFNAGLAYRLWNSNWKNIDLQTLAILCNSLKCTPSDLLAFTPDTEYR